MDAATVSGRSDAKETNLRVEDKISAPHTRNGVYLYFHSHYRSCGSGRGYLGPHTFPAGDAVRRNALPSQCCRHDFSVLDINHLSSLIIDMIVLTMRRATGRWTVEWLLRFFWGADRWCCHDPVCRHSFHCPYRSLKGKRSSFPAADQTRTSCCMELPSH